MNSSASSAVSGSSLIVAVPGRPSQSGCSSSSSCRAEQTSTIGTRLLDSTRWSRSSRNVGAASWMSSNRTMSGWSVASASNRRRIPQNSSDTGTCAEVRPIAAATRAAIWSRSGSSGSSSPRMRAWAVSAESSSATPAALRTASTIGQNVIASPYARHRPRSVTASDSCSSRNSWIRRDLPTPGSPTTVTSRQRWVT